jgi:hypothetical protein
MTRYLYLLPFLVATEAQAFTARNDMRVVPTGSTAFSVPWSGDSAATAFWCAAGDYVIRALGQPPGTRIYRTSPLPRRSGQPMQFSLSPEASIGSTGLAVLGSDDGGLSAAFAQNFCDGLDWPDED